MKPVGFGLAALTAAAASFYATSRYSSESLVSAPATATGKRDEEYWNSRWAKTIKMGERWDVGRTEIMLQDMLDSGEIKPKLADAKVLVPGCGRGYSLVSFANAGFQAVGVDISPIGAKTAEEYTKSQLKDELKSNVKVIYGDFFNLPKEHIHAYEVVFDSTFLCAIQPDRRKEWAETMAKVLKPGGILVQNIYPSKAPGEKEITMADDPGEGPPFLLSVKLAKELLEPHGFKVVVMKQAPKEKLSRDNGRIPYPYETWLISQTPTR